MTWDTLILCGILISLLFSIRLFAQAADETLNRLDEIRDKLQAIADQLREK